RLLPGVDGDHLLPVVRHLLQTVVSAQVDEVENILLKAGSSQADRRLQKLGSDSAVLSSREGDFIDIGARRLAQCRKSVHRGNALRQKRVRYQLGQLTRPEIRRQDPLARDPTRIDVDELLNCQLSGVRVITADEYAIRRLQIPHRRALGQEFGVRQDIELVAVHVRLKNALERFGGADGQRRLFNDNLVAVRNCGNSSRTHLDVGQIGGAPGTDAVRLGRGVNTDEDDVRLADSPVDVSREEQIPAPGRHNDLVESGFINGKLI